MLKYICITCKDVIKAECVHNMNPHISGIILYKQKDLLENCHILFKHVGYPIEQCS